MVILRTLLLKDLEKDNVVTLGRGKVISKSEINDMPGDYPVYSSSAQGDGIFGKYGKYMFDDERVTWSVDGGGRLFYRKPHKYSVTNVSGWIKVNQPDVLNTKYLYYCLTAQWKLRRFDYTYKAHPSVIREIYEVRIPSLHEQEKIVLKLEKLEHIIRLREQQMDILDNLVKARFVEMFGKNSGIKKAKIKDTCTLINGRAFKPSEWSNSGLPIVRIQNLNNSQADFNYCNFEVDDKYKITNGELLFSWSGTPGTSFGAFKWCGDEAVLNQHIFKVKPISDMDNDYLRFSLNMHLDEIIARAHGGVGLQHITKQELDNIYIEIPEIEDQKQFAKFATQIDKSKFALSNKLTMRNFYISLINNRIMHGSINLRMTQ